MVNKIELFAGYASKCLNTMSEGERRIFNQVSEEYANDMVAWSKARELNTRCLTCGKEFGEGAQCRTIREGKKKLHVCQTCWDKLKGGDNNE